MMYQLFEIRSSEQNIAQLPSSRMLRDEDVNDAFIREVINLPADDVITIQISDYISEKALRKLNELFRQRPDITFRVYGWIDMQGNDSWNISFLSLIPSVSKLTLDCFRCFNTDFSVLSELRNLKNLNLDILCVKDYSFLHHLTEKLEALHVNDEMKSGKSKIDCRCLLRFQSLHTLYLGHIEKNLESIGELPNLKKLTLRGVGAKDLSFLKKTQLKELEISWCNASRMDWNTLRDISSLKTLTLFSIKKLEDISFIATLTNLETLKLIWMGSVENIPDLSKLTKLRFSYFLTCNKLTDVSGLVEVRSLEKVFIVGKRLTREAGEKLLDNTSIKDLKCFGKSFRLCKGDPDFFVH